MIVLIDNYDSFSFNLVQLIGSNCEADIQVFRNDEKSVEEILAMEPEMIILSPGPGRPADAGICEKLAVAAAGRIPVLGVCLGHQGITEAFGGKITYAGTLMHGKQSTITIQKEDPIFAGLPEKIEVARYHSLAADRAAMPDCLEIIAEAADGEIMAVRHKEYPVYGLQFHPESVMTPDGAIMIRNFYSISQSYR